MRYTRCRAAETESYPAALISELETREHLNAGGGLVFVSSDSSGGAVVSVAFQDGGVVTENGYQLDPAEVLSLAEQLIRAVRRSGRSMQGARPK